jgi:hypothetical protein
MEESMTTFKRTTRGIARFPAWNVGTRGGRDMARRYHLLTRLTNTENARRRFVRRNLPGIAFS